MRKFIEYKFTETAKQKIMQFAASASVACILDSCNTQTFGLQKKYSDYDFIAGIGIFNELQIKKGNNFANLREYCDLANDWLLGYFSYDLKNEIETLCSENNDMLEFQELHFFIPELIFIVKNNLLKAGYRTEMLLEQECRDLVDNILSNNNDQFAAQQAIKFTPKVSKEQYIETIEKVKQHLKLGDIYEMNFCQEFFCKDANIVPIDVFQKLVQISPVPFAAFYRLNNHYLMCASPERFLKKQADKLISQPIKGTAKRGTTTLLDEEIKAQLQASEKEQAENVMIVDLVRNDLARTAKKASVIVEELCGLYSFPQVHQLISTVVSELKSEIHFTDAIKNAFPMGSMTGAPKIKAMELIEKYESTKRGLFSGAVGYIDPDNNFDFNVVIRSLLYNAKKQYLSYMVGGAITHLSDAEQEYDECLVKAAAINKLFAE